MGIEAVSFYRAICDACGANITEDTSEFSAWSEPGTAADGVLDSGGLVTGRVTVCWEDRRRYEATLADDDAIEALADEAPESVEALEAWVERERSGRESRGTGDGTR